MDGAKDQYITDDFPDRKKFAQVIEDFYADYERYFEIVSFYGMLESGDYSHHTLLTCVKSKASASGNFQPL